MNRVQNHPYICIATLSALLSIIQIASDGIINKDAIVYLTTAKTFLTHGLEPALQTFSWPFYPILGAIFSQITSLPLEYSFYTISTLLYAFIPVAFMRLYMACSGESRYIMIVGIIALLLPGLQDYRADIARDPGYWCFTLTALWAFIRYTQSTQIRFAITWQLSIGIAFLFRSEAIALLTLLPLAFFWFHRKALGTACRLWLYSNAIFIMVASLVALTQWHNIPTLLTKIPTLLSPASILESFFNASNIFGSEVLNKYSDEYASIMLFSGLIVLIITKMLGKIGFFHIVFCAPLLWRQPKKLIADANGLIIVLYAWLITFSILSVFSMNLLFMTGRYTLLAVLLLLVFACCRNMPYWAAKVKDKRWLKIALIMLAAIMLLDNVISFSPTKQYLKKAGQQLAQQPNIKQKHIWIGDTRLRYYADLLLNPHVAPASTHKEKENGNNNLEDYIQQFDIMALRIRKNRTTAFYDILKNNPNWTSAEPICNREKSECIFIYARQ